MMSSVNMMALMGALCCLGLAGALEVETFTSRKMLFSESDFEKWGLSDCVKTDNGNGWYTWRCTRNSQGGGGSNLSTNGDGGDGNEGDEGNEGNEGNEGDESDEGGNPSPPSPTPTPTQTEATTEPNPSSGSNQLSDNIDKSWGSCSDSMVADMVAADNADRSGGNLQCDDNLSQMAMEHSRDMCNSQNMGHQGFKDGSDNCAGSSRCARIMGELGYNAAAENVAYRSEDLDQQVAATHNAWMNSDGHRKNILNDGFTAVGYGFYVCESTEGGDFNAVYSTGLFGG